MNLFLGLLIMILSGVAVWFVCVILKVEISHGYLYTWGVVSGQISTAVILMMQN